ncbi:ArsR/SmtB family transcription factor [Methanosarcina sp. UBA5]|uniref:ArsR/SmtB family transcription factor n=1 Tax=Methanosarcina sp. UBA5 TaxID=1915593 RepID=UPI00374461ED
MDLVDILKALADENRLRILNILRNGELCVCDIETVLGIKQSNTSRHLNRLKVSGIITSQKKSKWVYYRLKDETFKDFSFLSVILNDEVEKIDICKKDLELLEKIKASGRCCD